MENTSIEWADATFNPWRGCTKVSPGCKFCYAETLSKRNPSTLGCWGPKGQRVIAAEAYWRQPLKWNAKAAANGERYRVFCASLADVFEAADTMPAESWPLVQAARLRLLRLIHDTPYLDWLCLTKRPENIVQALNEALDALRVAEGSDPNGLTLDEVNFYAWLFDWADGKRAPANVWLGTSVENQQQADIRVPQLLAAPATVRFLSCEPLLGPVSLDAWLKPESVHVSASREFWNNPTSRAALSEVISKAMGQACGLHWVIAGGESGSQARPMLPQWAISLRDQCQVAGVPFLFKQWGEYLEHCQACMMYHAQNRSLPIIARLGLKMLEVEGETLWRYGKHEAGRLLDGQEYLQFPSPTPVL